MGEIQNQRFPLSFNATLHVACQRSQVTSDGGLTLACELDERRLVKTGGRLVKQARYYWLLPPRAI